MNDIEHVGIILDGNRRWAKLKGKSSEYGHRKGAETLEDLIKKIEEKKLFKYLSVYIFSTENWKRSKVEVNYLMKLFKQFFEKILKNKDKLNVKINVLGTDKILSEELKKMKYKLIEGTKNNTGLVLNMCFNYGGRNEIIEATKKIAKDVKDGKITVDEIDEKLISNNLYTKDIPDPDLIIRTSGEQRLSNFLTWQSSYSELYFEEKYWPEFTIEDLERIIEIYGERERRFGGK